MSTEIDELKQARYRSDKTISGHNAFLRPPTGETNSVDTRGFYFVLKEPHPILFDDAEEHEHPDGAVHIDGHTESHEHQKPGGQTQRQRSHDRQRMNEAIELRGKNHVDKHDR